MSASALSDVHQDGVGVGGDDANAGHATHIDKAAGATENGELLTSAEVEQLVVRYLNSRIPVILGTPGHLTALIGVRREGDALEIIRCDDERGAYCPHRLSFTKGPERSMVLFVPLPGRIYRLDG